MVKTNKEFIKGLLVGIISTSIVVTIVLGFIFADYGKRKNTSADYEKEGNTVTEQELNDINDIIIEYFESGNENTFKLSAHYVDAEKKVVVVELEENSKEDQENFKKLVIDSEYIVFIQGGPYFNS